MSDLPAGVRPTRPARSGRLAGLGPTLLAALCVACASGGSPRVEPAPDAPRVSADAVALANAEAPSDSDALAVADAAPNQPASADAPNIVLVVIDDMGWADPAFMGHATHRTPRMDALAEQGLVFTRAYANAPNCAPSRASLLTGRTSPRHGVYTVGSARRGKARERKLVPPDNTRTLPDREVTLPELLAPAGYESAAMGKWHLGDDPTSQGFDLNVGGDAAGHPHNGYHAPWMNPNLADGPDGEWLTERLGREAADWIASRDGERPFLLYLSFYGVHTPLQAPQAAIDAERARGLTGKAAIYAAMVAGVDAALGTALDALDARGLADDTLVIVTSDNGGHLGATSNAPLRDGKGTLYEGGLRVPLVLRWPGHTRGGERDATPVQLVDLAPTLLAAAGLPLPEHILDGADLGGLLRGEPLRERMLFFHFPAYLEGSVAAHGSWRTTPASAVVHGDTKSILWWEHGQVETYDLAADPGETRPFSAHDERATRLQRVLDVWLQRTQAALPLEQEPRYREPAGR